MQQAESAASIIYSEECMLNWEVLIQPRSQKDSGDLPLTRHNRQLEQYAVKTS